MGRQVKEIEGAPEQIFHISLIMKTFPADRINNKFFAVTLEKTANPKSPSRHNSTLPKIGRFCY